MSNHDCSVSDRWYRRSRRYINVPINLLHALHSGFWMGVLSDDTFHHFDAYPYHDLQPNETPGDIDAGLERWEKELLANLFEPGRTALVVAAGGGRELLALLRAGVDAHGVEFNEAVANATDKALASRGFAGRIQVAPRYSLPAELGRFDFIFIARKFLSHVFARGRRVAFLRNLRAVSNENAILLSGFYIRDHNGLDWRFNSFLARMIRTLKGSAAERIELGDHLDPDTPLLHHHYRQDELQSELWEAGFSLLDFHQDWFGFARAIAVGPVHPGSGYEPTAAANTSAN